MNPWKGLLLTMGGVQLVFRAVPESFGRMGTWGFYTYVAGAMLVTSYVKPEYVGMAGIATGAYMMSTTNYVHPFNRGPNPFAVLRT